MTRVLFGGKESIAEAWRAALLDLRPDLDLVMSSEHCDPASVDIVLYEPSGPITDMAPYAGVAAIQSLWAGVETLLENPTLPTKPPLLRMVEDGLTFGMTDYVIGHVMRAHLGVAAQQVDQTEGNWTEAHPPLSRDRRVGIIGLGALGGDAAQMLAAMRFDVSGWSRSRKNILNVRCLSGTDGLQTLLQDSEIIVLLVPWTPETENMLDTDAFAAMRDGVHLINVARGALIDEDALLAALDSGKVATATLDVMREEPLPKAHRFWTHPNVMITPHIASVTRPETAAKTVIEQVERFETGQPFAHKVDREKGY